MSNTAGLEPQQITALSTIRDSFLSFESSRVGLIEKTNDLKSRVAVLLGESGKIVIDSADKRETANYLLREQAALVKEGTALAETVKKPSYDLWKSFCALETDMSKPLVALRGAIEPVALAYDRAERQRKAEEAARLAEEQRKRDEEALLAEALRLEAEGHTQLADQVFAQEVIPSPIFIAPEQKSEGVAKNARWVHDRENIDLLKLAKAVVDGVIPPHALLPNHTFLDGKAKSDKQFAKVPGVIFKEVEGLRISA